MFRDHRGGKKGLERGYLGIVKKKVVAKASGEGTGKDIAIKKGRRLPSENRKTQRNSAPKDRLVELNSKQKKDPPMLLKRRYTGSL